MTPEQRQAVLAIARSALVAAVQGGQAPAAPDVTLPEDFGGAFVTLKKGGRLRGCMGTFKPLGTLAETIAEVTRMSCCEDPRFVDKRIDPSELDNITIESSILDEPKLTDDPASLEIGRHGIWVRRGAASGCLLPQVAAERGWTAEEFLRQCCVLKAGLPADAWKDQDTRTYLFAAEIVSEPQPPGHGLAGSRH